MNLFALIVRRSPFAFGIAVVCGLASGATTAVLLSRIEAGSAATGTCGAECTGTYVGLAVLYWICNLGSCALVILLSQGAVMEIRLRLCRAIYSAPLRRLEDLGTARLHSVLSDDVSAISSALSVIPGLAINSTVVVGGAVYMGILSPVGLLRFVGLLAVALLMVRFVAFRAVKSMKLARDVQDKLFGHFRTITEGAKELKLNDQRADGFFRSLTLTAESARVQGTLGHTVYALAWSFSEMLFFITIGLLIMLPLWSPLAADARPGYLVVMLYIFPCLTMILFSMRELARGGVALRKIEEVGLDLGNAAPELSGSASAGVARSTLDTIELRSVTYQYAEDSFTVGPIDIVVRPGELVFVIGGNGSGKTTLARLLCGLYTPTSGTILLDGVEVTDHDRAAYRQRFSAVFSDFYLFDELPGQLSEELEARARRILVEFQLDHKVKIEKGSFSTTELSQGQRKRLALLGAFLEDRPVLLFDEWAADQDPTFKSTFYREILLDLKARNKAVIVISHDDRYFDLADRILKLEDGKLVEAGSP